MTTLILTLSVALVFYLNFKWGYSQAFGGPGLEHEVRERDYFFIASFAAWGVWVGMGIATLMEWIDEALAARAARPAPARLWAPSALVLLLALVPLAGNRLTAPDRALDEPFLSRRLGGHAPGLYPARAAGHRLPRAHRGRARSRPARAPVPDAVRPGGAADHQG